MCEITSIVLQLDPLLWNFLKPWKMERSYTHIGYCNAEHNKCKDCLHVDWNWQPVVCERCEEIRVKSSLINTYHWSAKQWLLFSCARFHLYLHSPNSSSTPQISEFKLYNCYSRWKRSLQQKLCCNEKLTTEKFKAWI